MITRGNFSPIIRPQVFQSPFLCLALSTLLKAAVTLLLGMKGFRDMGGFCPVPSCPFLMGHRFSTGPAGMNECDRDLTVQIPKVPFMHSPAKRGW